MIAALVLYALTAAQVVAHNPVQRDQMVVSPAWLAAHLSDKQLVVIHVGMGDADLYKAEHIAGAQYIKMEEFAAPGGDATIGRLNLELPPDADLAATLARHGITPASTVVLYFGKNEVSEATRVILTLDHAGLGAHAALLQGGFPAWKRGGYPTTAEVRSVTPAAVMSLTPKRVTVDAAVLQNSAGKPGVAIVDARDQAAYDGISGGMGRAAGHIPGAVSLYYRSLYNEANELRPAAELAAAFAKAGVKPGDTVMAYCWLGQFATATLFAARSLGYEVLLYDGSIEDWTARHLPLEATRKGGGSR